MAAYQRDILAIAELITDGRAAELTLADITKSSLRVAFSEFARTHAAASIKRCWSTWNVLCTYLCTTDQLAANPMAAVGQPRASKPLPRALTPQDIWAVLANVAAERGAAGRGMWAERDLAMLLTGLSAGARASEICGLNIGDLRRPTNDQGILHIRGKGNKVRAVPVELPFLVAVDDYLLDRASRFPKTLRRNSSPADGLAAWPARSALFVGLDGRRISSSTLDSRTRRAFRQVQVTPPPGSMVHSLRHTYATLLAESGTSVYSLMTLLGHESISSSQRYVTAAGIETRAQAAKNPVYEMAAGLAARRLPQKPPSPPARS